ncbi:MAG: hypothetical protein U9R02_09700, partial [Thermodesulfobacteriota bacterium]|nr:hypothetical protein [Thermodesulfobacteriota bacterium]
RRCIPPDCVAKILNMLDIHAFSRLVSRAPQHLKLRTYSLPNPFNLNGNVIFKALGFMPAAGPIKNK